MNLLITNLLQLRFGFLQSASRIFGISFSAKNFHFDVSLEISFPNEEIKGWKVCQASHAPALFKSARAPSNQNVTVENSPIVSVN